VDVWEAYIRAGIALQNERGALAVAEHRGREQGLKDGREQTLRLAMEALCSVLDIALDAERKRLLESSPVAALTVLFDQLREQKAWPE
jgi:hypothetical protein